MVITAEIKRLKDILDMILGEPKQELDDSMQLEYACPHCIEKYGFQEHRKYNLSVSLSKQVFQCWKCASEDDDMKGTIVKLIKMYGNDKLLDEYKAAIRDVRESELYRIHFKDNEFSIDTSIIEKDELRLPGSFKRFKYGSDNRKGALRYLIERGIGWDIINRYGIGYTEAEDDGEFRKYSYRIVIPSHNSLGELNYWVARDYIPNSTRQKYANPKAEKKNIIFNEDKVQWDSDITLVEGPFDHIVVPNSIPLLGKAIDTDCTLYWELLTKANANINIFLDADARDTAMRIYSMLNHGRLYGRIRYIPVGGDDDPSSLYQSGGYRRIAAHLANARQISDVYLQ